MTATTRRLNPNLIFELVSELRFLYHTLTLSKFYSIDDCHDDFTFKSEYYIFSVTIGFNSIYIVTKSFLFLV